MTTNSIGALALRRSLQAWLALSAAFMIWAALNSMIFGIAPYIDGTLSPAFDNHTRYVAGVYLVFPFLLLWTIPSVERHAAPIRIVAAATMCGGIGRLMSFMQHGSGDSGQLVMMGIELCSPLLIVWQRAAALRHPIAGAKP